MRRNSAEVLDYHLSGSSELQQEWIQYQKLRKDPRITQVGKVNT